VSAPERIGKYRVLEPIGRGGMGSVYKAHDPLLDRMVAIKVMAEDAEAGTEARQRFLREARSAARLNHPNIITVYELGEDQGRVFIVMELLEGEPLSRLIGRVPPVPLRRKLGLMMQICDGLAFAHQRGVVHRDIKPGNIFVLDNGQVKILDFGIARVGSSELTRTGLLMGTPTYMSPEQARGRRSDARSDIFSVGVVFYELLSGRKPFVGEDYFETLEKVRSDTPPPLASVAPGLPVALVGVVERAMAKDPAARYQSLEDVKLDLVGLPEALPAAASAAEELREAVDRQFAELVRLHRTLVAAIGSSALGDETIPLAEPAGAGAGLETVLQDLERRTDRLRGLARTVERVEPAVARGIAAFERGAFGEAIAELDQVLKEIPLHQRARDYRERARLEAIRERTVKAPLPVGVAATPAPAEPATLPPATTSVTGATRVLAGGRPRLLVGAGAVALVAGALYLFAPGPSPRVPAPASRSGPPSGAGAVAAPAPPTSPGAAGAPRAPVEGPAGSGAAGSTPADAPPGRPAPPTPSTRREAPKPSPRTLTPQEAKVVEDALTLAQLFRARGDTARAVREYRRVLELDPDNIEARRGMADARAAGSARP